MTPADLIKANEGLRLTPYRCTSGKLTIGYGKNLEAGITPYLAELILQLDIDACVGDLRRMPFFARLNGPRQDAIVDMRYQLGGAGFRGFKKMIAALERDDYYAAAAEMLDSKYATQTPVRAQNNARIMRTGRHS